MLRLLYFMSLMSAILGYGPVFAQDANVQPRFEVYTGVSAAETGGSGYTSVVWSPRGSVREQGWRLRSGADYGVVRDRHIYGDERVTVKKKSQKTVADVGLGYQGDLRFLWLKLYGGGVFRDETIRLDGHTTNLGSTQFGAYIAVESWWRLGHGFWSSVDLKWTTLDNGISVFSRLGYSAAQTEHMPGLGAGLEASVHADDIDALSQKGGVFVQGVWGFHEVTLSGGLSQTDQSDDWKPYASVSYGRKF